MSKVRSVTLDAWEPELVKVMAELGNAVINRVYEANVDESVAKHATPQCNRSVAVSIHIWFENALGSSYYIVWSTRSSGEQKIGPTGKKK